MLIAIRIATRLKSPCPDIFYRDIYFCGKHIRTARGASPVPDPLPLETQLCFSLSATTIAINRAYKPLLDSLGITYPQYLVLNTLWEEDARTITAIADRLAPEPNKHTALVKRLQ